MQVQPYPKNMPFIQDKDKKITKREASDFAPIRTHIVLHETISNNETILSEFSTAEGPFQQALNVLSNALQVRPVRGNFTVPPPCNEITFGANAGKCWPGTVQEEYFCVEFELPTYLLGTREVCDGPFGECHIEGPDGEGVNADYFLRVAAIHGNSI